MQLNGETASLGSFVSSHESNFPGHTFIDVLNFDIEGAKFDTLTTFLAAYKLMSPFLSTTLLIAAQAACVGRLWQV
jgi:hypothetical protein